jgi:hypothetical protein
MKRLDAETIKAVADQIRAALGDDFDDSAFWDTVVRSIIMC